MSRQFHHQLTSYTKRMGCYSWVRIQYRPPDLPSRKGAFSAHFFSAAQSGLGIVNVFRLPRVTII